MRLGTHDFETSTLHGQPHATIRYPAQPPLHKTLQTQTHCSRSLYDTTPTELYRSLSPFEPILVRQAMADLTQGQIRDPRPVMAPTDRRPRFSHMSASTGESRLARTTGLCRESCRAGT